MTSHDPRLCGPARALLVIEQRVLADDVKLALNHGHYSTRVTPTVNEAGRALADWRPHFVVIDVDSPAGTVLDQLADPTRQPDRPPVMALTRCGDVNAKLNAFGRGVDDVLTIPFSPEELVARILALMRRTYREAVAFMPVLRLGDLEIDILNRRVRAGNRDLHLTALEQSLLYLLAVNAGRPLTRNEILDYLWGADYVAESNVVDRHIRNLRVKLRNHAQQPHCILTVPRRGYKFLATLVTAKSSD